MQFKNLGLSQTTLKAVDVIGYTEATPIQAQVIPHILKGRDVFGCAQTGTGKTASFTLPMIDLLSSGQARARMPRSLILIPTRELAAQVVENFQVYNQLTQLKHALLIGGESATEQQRILQRGVDVIIATPGRLLDLFERGYILLNDIKLLVVDEADRMLDMGFIPDIEKLFSILPQKKQTLLFSATMPKEIKRLSRAFLQDPVEVIITPPTMTAETITQYVLPVNEKKKRIKLREILSKSEPSINHAIIFCNRKKDATNLSISLKRYKYNCAVLHGDLTQAKRTQTLEAFRAGEINILVASDVAARGLDIETITHVFNFDIPISAEDYIHRIGRTGRAGQSGTAITFLLEEEIENWRNILKEIKAQVLDYDSGEIYGSSSKQNLDQKSKKASLGKKISKKEYSTKKGEGKPSRSNQKPSATLAKIPNIPVKGFGEHIPAFWNIKSKKRSDSE